jgi:hypothetical protein
MILVDRKMIMGVDGGTVPAGALLILTATAELAGRTHLLSLCNWARSLRPEELSVVGR